MKASEITKQGFYWSDHGLGFWIAEGKTYPREWDIMEVHVDTREAYCSGGEIPIYLNKVPDYVNFYGPLEPPIDVAS